MSVEMTTPATYTCKCDRDGVVEEIQGNANDAFAAGWVKVTHVGQATQAAPAGAPTPGMPGMPTLYLTLPATMNYDLCPQCAAAFATFMGLNK